MNSDEEDQYSYAHLSRVMRSNTQAGSANTNNYSKLGDPDWVFHMCTVSVNV